MTKLTKEEVASIIAELNCPYGSVVLRCDDDTITVTVEQTKPRRYDLVVYVNGWFKSAYMREESREHRYLRPVTKSAWTPARRAKLIKSVGVRRAKQLFNEPGQSYTFFHPVWTSPTAMLRHYNKVCKVVRLVSVGVQIGTSSEAIPGVSDV